MVLGIQHFKVNIENHEKFLDVLANLPERAISTKGCLFYALYQEPRDSESFILLEKWESRKDLSRFVKSDDYRRVFFAIDLCREMPQIQFFKAHLEGGIKTLEKLLRTELLE